MLSPHFILTSIFRIGTRKNLLTMKDILYKKLEVELKLYQKKTISINTFVYIKELLIVAGNVKYFNLFLVYLNLI